MYANSAKMCNDREILLFRGIGLTEKFHWKIKFCVSCIYTESLICIQYAACSEYIENNKAKIIDNNKWHRVQENILFLWFND